MFLGMPYIIPSLVSWVWTSLSASLFCIYAILIEQNILFISFGQFFTSYQLVFVLSKRKEKGKFNTIIMKCLLYITINNNLKNNSIASFQGKQDRTQRQPLLMSPSWTDRQRAFLYLPPRQQRTKIRPQIYQCVIDKGTIPKLRSLNLLTPQVFIYRTEIQSFRLFPFNFPCPSWLRIHRTNTLSFRFDPGNLGGQPDDPSEWWESSSRW